MALFSLRIATNSASQSTDGFRQGLVPFPYPLTDCAPKTYLFHFPRTALYWLDAWPAGLKLNAELSRFYANTLIGLIDTWYCKYISDYPLSNPSKHLTAVLPPLSPSFFTTLGFMASIGGCTLFLSLLADIISFFLTAHLRIGYELTRLVYWAAGVKLGGGLLWGLFRGTICRSGSFSTRHFIPAFYREKT